MKGADGVANTIRSGGTTRRAAKMVVMNVDHPDLKDFINCKKSLNNIPRRLRHRASPIHSTVICSHPTRFCRIRMRTIQCG